jgi:hypothetical protein
MGRNWNHFFPLLGNYLTIKTVFSRTKNDYALPSDDTVENHWDYHLIYDEKNIDKNTFRELEKYINDSIITTKLSRTDKTVEIKSLKFDWLIKMEEQVNPTLLSIDQTKLEYYYNEFEKDLNMNLTSKEVNEIFIENLYSNDFINYLITKFIGLAILQLVDYYCYGYNFGKVNPLVNEAKTLVINKSQVDISKKSKGILSILENISYTPSNRKQRTLFLSDSSDKKKLYVKRDTIIAAASNFENKFAYWKVMHKYLF